MSREARVGLLVMVGLGGVVALMAAAAGGPGMLKSRATVDVTFRDAQGVRPGNAVRVAGLEVGRVAAVDLVEIDHELRAKVRLSLPEDLAERLRQDAKVTIQPSLTGQACVNIVAVGRSQVAHVPGTTLAGVETTMFDPILDQVGLGPVERDNLRHTVAEVRRTIDATAPNIRQMLASLQEAAEDIRQTTEAIQPTVTETGRRIDEAAPRVEAILTKLDNLVVQADAIVAENRPNVQGTLASLRALTADGQALVADNRPKVDALLTGLDGTRARADRVLYQADLLAGQGATLVSQHRADIDRVLTNARDATDYGRLLVQKLYGNPFYLSPFYKPTAEDVHAQAVYDTTQAFTQGARELRDAVTTLQAMRDKPLSGDERKALDALYLRAVDVTGRLDESTRRLAEELRADPARARARR